MNITLIYLLLKLKNFSVQQKEYVYISYNKQYIEVLKILYQQGLIQSYKLQKNAIILIVLRYYFNKPIFKDLKIVSKPSNSYYLKLIDLHFLSDKKYKLFISTSKGLLTGMECKQYGLGGKLLFIC
jgi:small subunit ribosomal protein S8